MKTLEGSKSKIKVIDKNEKEVKVKFPKVDFPIIFSKRYFKTFVKKNKVEITE